MKEWQYNGVASWADIIDWCTKTFGPRDSVSGSYYWKPPGRWKAQWETVYFTRDEDYEFFLLRWA